MRSSFNPLISPADTYPATLRALSPVKRDNAFISIFVLSRSNSSHVRSASRSSIGSSKLYPARIWSEEYLYSTHRIPARSSSVRLPAGFPMAMEAMSPNRPVSSAFSSFGSSKAFDSVTAPPLPFFLLSVTDTGPGPLDPSHCFFNPGPNTSAKTTRARPVTAPARIHPSLSRPEGFPDEEGCFDPPG